MSAYVRTPAHSYFLWRPLRVIAKPSPAAPIGGGVEHAFLASNWSVVVEGRYTTYGTHSFNTGSLVTFLGPFPFLFSPMTDHLKLYTVEALFKLNYRFGAFPY